MSTCNAASSLSLWILRYAAGGLRGASTAWLGGLVIVGACTVPSGQSDAWDAGQATPESSNGVGSLDDDDDAGGEDSGSEDEEGDDDDDDDDNDDDDDDDDAPKFDIGEPDEGDPPSGEGCEKVDFVFLVDNSGSMADEQTQLTAAFPEFIATIRETVTAQDYHIMVIDSDGPLDPGNCNGSPDVVACCAPYCAENPMALCGGQTCPGVDPCHAVIGAARFTGPANENCGVEDGLHYLTDAQPNLEEVFECIATVGTGGDGREVQMQSVTESVGTQAEAGQCNEGFLRDDAILVVTLVTDEEDDPNDGGDNDPNSPGDPTSWREAIVAAKHGNVDAIVALGLVGDSDLPGSECPPHDPASGDGAEPAPRLRAFVESFGDRGVVGSVCADDYGPFFLDAVSDIDDACDEFIPE